MTHNLYLIRHARTEGNIQGKYIGVTDEPLCRQGINDLRECKKTGMYPKVQYLFVSPLIRCLQTMAFIYPDIPFTIVPELAECNFGLFEGRTYEQLKNCIEYQSWVASDGKGPIPEGENSSTFRTRCYIGFEIVITKMIKDRIQNSALIVHGGTIMAVMERYAEQKSDFYHWRIENCEGYKLEIDSVSWLPKKKVQAVTKL